VPRERRSHLAGLACLATLVVFAFAVATIEPLSWPGRPLVTGGWSPPSLKNVIPLGSVSGQVLLEPPRDDESRFVGTLDLPHVGTCSVHVWRAGKRIADTVVCTADGSFTVSAEAGPATVEVLVPGRLRAALDVTVEANSNTVLPALALGFAEHVGGQVIDTRGRPVENVEVQAMPVPNLGETEPWRAFTSSHGQFLFETLPPGPCSLRAVLPGYAPSVVEAVAPELDVVIAIDALMDLHGEVVAAPDLLARSRIRLEGSAIWPALEAPLGVDGKFTYLGIPDGVYGLEVIAEATTPGEREYASVPLENITPELYIRLALVEAFRVPVRVVDPDGEPVPNARVTLGYSSIGMLQRVATTGIDGKTALGPVVAGPYIVHADADGFLPSEAIDVEVPDRGEVELQTLVLVRPGWIHGIVVDDRARLVQEATILVESDAPYSVGESTIRAELFETAQTRGSLGVTRGPVPPVPAFPAEATHTAGQGSTDSSGAFTLGPLLPGTYTIYAVHEHHTSSQRVTLSLSSGEIRTGIRLLLGRGAPLTGRVRDENGRPLAHARIEFGDGFSVITDGFGVFDAGTHHGTVSLVVRAPGKVPQRIHVNLDEQAIDVEVVLLDANARVSGRVRDGNGRPIEHAHVLVRHRDGLSPTEFTWTNDRGVFELEHLPPGDIEVSVEHPDYAPVSTSAELTMKPTHALDLVVEPGWTLEVLVRESGTGRPIEAAIVQAGGRESTSDQRGTAVLDRLVGEQMEVTVTAPDRLTARHTVARPSSGQAHWVAELGDGGSLEGTVTDDRGQPVIGARVVVQAENGTLLGEARTRSSGFYQLDGLPEGRVWVQAVAPPSHSAVLARAWLRSDVRRGQITQDVDLRFEPQ